MNKIGLDSSKATEIAEKLNILLANYQVLYTNTRGFHWNIKGKDFFELHLKFEEIYNDLQVKIDEIAERILTLGNAPKNSFSDYLKLSSIKEVSGETNGVVGLQNILDGFLVILKIEREILQLSGEINDEGSNALVSGYITEHEKSVWMFNAYLNK
jgi:starvation-inducible DNA-binding protein